MKMIYEYARNRAGLVPDKIAISLDNEHLSYWKLETQSNQLAELLIRNGLKAGDRVAMLLGKKPKAITAMHGISKAGGIYVPLDIHDPVERTGKILLSAEASFIFADSTVEPLLQTLRTLLSRHQTPFIWWDEEHPNDISPNEILFHFDDIHNEPDFPHAVINDSHSPAQILFTSASSGTPKGVIITHQNMTTFIDWARHYFEMNEDDRLSCYSPFHVGHSSFDIYGAMSVGARVFLVPSDISNQPQKVANFISDNRLTQWFSVPSALNYIAFRNVILNKAFTSLKRLIWSGEVFPTSSLRYWMEKLPHVQFTNLYGPTETTIASSYHTVFQIPAPEDDIPIGRACAGEQLWVLNEKMQLARTGRIGELYISGSGLSPGYWRDEAKTKAAFTWWKNPGGRKIRIYKTGDLASLRRDLNIYYHGRSDYQVKIKGCRVELGEIEQALKELNVLEEFAVVTVGKESLEGVTGITIGCAYVPLSKTKPVTQNELRERLLKKIPSYMLPHIWKTYTLLPRDANNKIARKQLSDELAEQITPKLVKHDQLLSH